MKIIDNIIVLWLIFLAMVGNGNFGWGNNGGANSAALQGAVTRADLADGLNNQTVLGNLRTIDSDVGNGITSINQSLCSGFNGVNSTVVSNANMLNQSLNTLNSTTQMGFCGVNNNINTLKYEMAQNCCDIKSAMHSEGEATRALIQANTVQDLRDKLADKAGALAEAQNALSNANQTQAILTQLGKFYPTCNCSVNSNNW